ncbi:hypothetical protein OLZ32_38875 [Rhizobium sp. 1AS11]|uniref:hypothetical protein n=1 Tax=Rhizobium acaciae TaxID=2989736 RepID=UPI002223A92D|nr:hypothetical protein [Rhizobium acaciae]MCW1414136.1 hypothetical protein [Rhizobium acaciae]MCW1746296.1 hypothetical protein [Rhizobium acaciae]
MTQIREPERRSRILRGRPYTLYEFASKYGLKDEQAKNLFRLRRLRVRQDRVVPQDSVAEASNGMDR